MDAEKFNKYAQLKVEAALIAEQIKDLAPEIISMMEVAKAEKVPLKSGLGSFSLVPFRTYKYSNKVKEVESEVKRLKDDEKASGVAEVVEVASLKFFAKKVE